MPLPNVNKVRTQASPEAVLCLHLCHPGVKYDALHLNLMWEYYESGESENMTSGNWILISTDRILEDLSFPVKSWWIPVSDRVCMLLHLMSGCLQIGWLIYCESRWGFVSVSQMLSILEHSNLIPYSCPGYIYAKCAPLKDFHLNLPYYQLHKLTGNLTFPILAELRFSWSMSNHPTTRMLRHKNDGGYLGNEKRSAGV